MTYQYRPIAADEAGKRKLQPSQKQGIVWRKAIDGREEAEHFCNDFSATYYFVGLQRYSHSQTISPFVAHNAIYSTNDWLLVDYKTTFVNFQRAKRRIINEKSMSVYTTKEAKR